MPIPNFATARILQPYQDEREGNYSVEYEPIPLPPVSRSLAVTSPGTLAGAPVSRTLQDGTTILEIGDLSNHIVLRWCMSFGGSPDAWGTATRTWANTLSTSNYDVFVMGGQQPMFFGIPDGVVSYIYDHVTATGTPIFIER